jgi:hypothetical protein
MPAGYSVTFRSATGEEPATPPRLRTIQDYPKDPLAIPR